MNQNISLGSNGVDRVRSLRKIPTQVRGTNFCTSSARFAPSFVRQPNGVHPNSTKRTKTSVLGPIGWIGCVRCEKFQCNFSARTFALIAPVQPVLHQASGSNEILPNTSKHYEMHTNMSLGSNGVDRVCSLWKILMRLRGKNFCINCTSSTRFAPSFV